MMRQGRSPDDACLEALRTATLYNADLFSKTDRGVIATGTLADLIAVDGNPLTDITALQRVAFVMLSGTVVKEKGVATTR